MIEMTTGTGDRRPTQGAAPIVDARSVVHLYARDDDRVVALDGLDLVVGAAEFSTITGASGSGKSTLLRLLAGQEAPTAGTVSVAGHRLDSLDVRARERFRRDTVGIVQQQTADNLFPYLDALANVSFPMALRGTSRRRRHDAAMGLLDLVGVADRAGHRPSEMSGGEQQRVAIAVALANQPALVLADEPTGELDAASTTDVVEAFERARTELGITVLAVTHDPLVAERTARTIEIRNGRVEAEIHRTPGDPSSARRRTVVDGRGALQLGSDVFERLAGTELVDVELRSDAADDRDAPGEAHPDDGPTAGVGWEPG